VKAFEVVEHDASKGHKQRSDLNGALNILKKATNSVVSTVRRTPSFLVDHNPVAPVKGRNPRDLGIPRPSGRRGCQVKARPGAMGLG